MSDIQSGSGGAALKSTPEHGNSNGISSVIFVMTSAVTMIAACFLLYMIVENDTPWSFIFLATIFPACSFLLHFAQQLGSLDFVEIVQLICLFFGAGIYFYASVNRNFLPLEWIGAATGVGSLFSGIGIGGLTTSRILRK